MAGLAPAIHTIVLHRPMIRTQPAPPPSLLGVAWMPTTNAGMKVTRREGS